MKGSGPVLHTSSDSLSYFHGPLRKYEGSGFTSQALTTCSLLGVGEGLFWELTSLGQSIPGLQYIVFPVEEQGKRRAILALFPKGLVDFSLLKTSDLQQQEMIYLAGDPAFPGPFLNLVIVQAVFVAEFRGHRGNTMIRKNPDAMSQEEILTDVARILFTGYQKLIKRQDSRNGNLTRFEGKAVVSSTNTAGRANGL